MSEKGDTGFEINADTLEATSTGAAPVDPDTDGPIAAGFDRYRPGDLLGTGGMGEVRRYSDRTIGREVAVKIARDRGGEADRRFEREARVQGQLEHPGIVPVYDLGTRADGTPYFTMKRVKGRTLEAIIDGLRRGDDAIAAEYSRHRLLAAFATACQAVAYANARGVVHRDLKPANIILGDFGEVYVLDWGIAKVFGDVDDSPVITAESAAPEAATQAGSLLGTPGYMAPEQVRAEGAIDARTDVWALGAILFELLTLERFVRGKSIKALLAATLEAGPARPRDRAAASDGDRETETDIDRDIPPELDALCARATAPDPEDRPRDARELVRELERFLAGERDARQRRALADEHVAAAEALLSDSRDDPERDVEIRSQAIRELFAAFALDRDNAGARQAMRRALSDSGELPESARDELEAVRSAQRRRVARNATIALSSLIGLIPLTLWNGVANTAGIVAIIAAWAVATTGAFVISRLRRSPSGYYIVLMVVLGGFIAATSTLFGPYFLTPALALGCCAGLISGARLPKRWRAVVIAIGIAAVLVPALLQGLGGTWSYAINAAGALEIRPSTLEFSPDRIWVLLTITAVASVLLPSMLVGRSVDVLHQAEEQQFAQAWRLRQIFPDDV